MPTNTTGEAAGHGEDDCCDSVPSSTNGGHSDGSSSDSCHSELALMLRSTSITLESGNPCRRGRTRSDHRRKKRGDVVDRIGQNKKMLRMKFEIEGLYEEIYELKRENEELWRIWERVRQTSPARGSGGEDVMRLKRASPVAHFGGQVPCMVQVSDAIDNMGHASDLECNSDRDCE